MLNSNRLKKTTSLFVILVVIVGTGKMLLLKQVPSDLLPLPRGFWWLKTHTQERFDIVAIGDSRIYRAVSPAEISQVIKGSDTLNFGYSGAGLTSRLVDAGVEKLNYSGKKILILGVTPLTLTESAALDKHYLECKNISPLFYFFPLLDRLFEPETTEVVLRKLVGRFDENRGYFQKPNSNGWIESVCLPENPDYYISGYRKLFDENKVSPRILKELCAIVRHLTKQQITVFALRPPSCLKMEILENEISGYNEDIIKQDIIDAGGIWIDIKNRFEYATYDGSHLRGDSAILFSRDLAEAVHQHIIEKPVIKEHAEEHCSSELKSCNVKD